MVVNSEHLPKEGSGYRSRLCQSAPLSRRSRDVWSLPTSSSPDADYQTHGADSQNDSQNDDEVEAAPMDEGSDGEDQDDWVVDNDGLVEQGSFKQEPCDKRSKEGSLTMALMLLAE